jgi:RNA polymerase sigma-70 factor (ECF subfamily)
VAELDVDMLFREHGAFVWRVLRHHGVADRDLDDACQEVFVVAQRQRARFREGQPSSWLYGIAWRVASAFRRKGHARREELGGESDLARRDAEPQTPDDELDQRRRASLLSRALEALDDDKRAVFVLFEIEELDMIEIAKMLGIPKKTAYSRLYAARALLRDEWNRLAGGPP